MKSQSKTHTSVTLYLDKRTVKQVKKAAKADRRSVSKYVDHILAQYLSEAQPAEGGRAA